MLHTHSKKKKKKLDKFTGVYTARSMSWYETKTTKDAYVRQHILQKPSATRIVQKFTLFRSEPSWVFALFPTDQLWNNAAKTKIRSKINNK